MPATIFRCAAYSNATWARLKAGRPLLPVAPEHFPNLRGVAKCVQGGFFLRKKPLDGINLLYSNSKNAIAIRYG
jgi:hypothetical protein